jgi:hypothetical protein
MNAFVGALNLRFSRDLNFRDDIENMYCDERSMMGCKRILQTGNVRNIQGKFLIKSNPLISAAIKTLDDAIRAQDLHQD